MNMKSKEISFWSNTILGMVKLEFDPGPLPYFRGDLSWNNFYGQSPPSADSRRVGVSYKQKNRHWV